MPELSEDIGDEQILTGGYGMGETLQNFSRRIRSTPRHIKDQGKKGLAELLTTLAIL